MLFGEDQDLTARARITQAELVQSAILTGQGASTTEIDVLLGHEMGSQERVME